jgi:hypothetical protein
MAQVVIAQQETPKYSENLFPLFTAFNEPYTGWNIISGNGTVDNSDIEKYKGNNSLRVITNEVDTVLVFDSANTGFSFVAPKTGNYIFSVKVFISSDYDRDEVFGIFDTYINSSGIGDFQFEWSNQAAGFVHDEWNNFFQIVQLTEDDVYDLSFKFYADAIGCRAYLDGFKMELDNRSLGIPSRYTFPLEVVDYETGWQQITDSTYTVAAPLSILEGVTGKISTGTVTEINTQIPTGVTTFWNNTTDKLVAVNNGDAFSMSLRFKAKMDVLNAYFDVGINIGGSLGTIAQTTQVFQRLADTEQIFTVELDYFTGTTFIANGGNIQITPINGDILIYDIVILITRTHKGR